MRSIAFTLLSIFLTLTLSASADEVSVLYNKVYAPDSIPTPVDTISTQAVDTLAADTTARRRLPWYWRFYNFASRVLSPPRDPNYIEVQDYYNWCAELQLTARFETYEMNASNDFSMRVAPNTRWRLGPFFGWRFAFLGYNFDIKSLFFNTDDTDLSGSIYSAAFGLDLFYRRVGGEYNIRKLQIGDVDYTKQLEGRRFNGIHQGMTRLSFYYITKYKHYSHQAAFNQTNRQVRSAGSPIIGLQYAHNSLSVETDKLADLIGTNTVSNTTLANLLREQKNDEISITAGYGYNWVFAKNFLAAGELTGAFGYLVQHTDVEDRETSSSFLGKVDDFYRKNIAFNANFRFAVLYNNGPWFAGTQVVGFYYQYGNGTVMTRNLLGCAYFFVGYNFRTFKVKKKREKN